MWSITAFLLFALVWARRKDVAHGWVSPQTARHNVMTPLWMAADSSSTTTESAPVMGGVSDFEAWFASQSGTSCLDFIQHASFGSLRGLTFISDPSLLEPNTQALTLPKELVLQTPFATDWDSQLAQALWKECLLGTSSKVYGYCSLLTRGVPVSSTSCPPSAAPNALRHWTASQKQWLEESASGRSLLELEQKQESLWRQQFNSATSKLTWEQFQWAMEVVHSRAFKGEFGLAPGRTVVAAGVPLAAAAAGWFGVLQDSEPNLLVLGALAVVAAAPTMFNAVFPQKGDVVLLPLIDSANHLEQADSSIEYDPLRGAFSLTIGPKCLVKESNGETQLYISYGAKKDTELLLNYGFLPGVPSGDGQDYTVRDAKRQRLAEAFVKRN